MDVEIDYLQKHQVSLFLDVGANIGQTGVVMRSQGYQGRIGPRGLCFQPIWDNCAAIACQTADETWARTSMVPLRGESHIP